MCAQSLQSCPVLWDPMDYNLPGSSVYGILQARILECVAMPFSCGGWGGGLGWGGGGTGGGRVLPNPGIKPMFHVSPVLAIGFFTSRETPTKYI